MGANTEQKKKQEPYAAGGVGCANTLDSSLSPGFFFFPARERSQASQLRDGCTAIDEALFSSNHKLV